MPQPIKRLDPIPDEFASYEDAAEFWDSHDTADYLNDFATVEAKVEFRGRHFEVEVEEDVMALLRMRSRKLGISVNNLASDLLRKQLSSAA
jgi:predicted HicB family RNase H-like nuclease